ncbi:hypothetical protein GQ57_06375 [Burkholderia sp. MSh2]|uniref:Uncharacterized protein n=1 Tax=Burkholderia paludis TaxID=1506587 RepID=A0A6J5DJ35_9BURK|nr:hypothetical protein GQ57_06375 [Burkholderia sp. MSh2]CAB3754179.1 hypothetical protein LMG30113_02158 [Burkholderia paludis]VWB78267.1 hypothetical protein BPA30113_03574 [Burkholderia paludis]
MACQIRFAGVVRASARRRLPVARAALQSDDGRGVRRRAAHDRDAGRGAVACGVARPAVAVSEAPASGSRS